MLDLTAQGKMIEDLRPWQLQVSVDQIAAAGRQEQITHLSGLQDTLAAQMEQILRIEPD